MVAHRWENFNGRPNPFAYNRYMPDMTMQGQNYARGTIKMGTAPARTPFRVMSGAGGPDWGRAASIGESGPGFNLGNPFTEKNINNFNDWRASRRPQPGESTAPIQPASTVQPTQAAQPVQASLFGDDLKPNDFGYPSAFGQQSLLDSGGNARTFNGPDMLTASFKKNPPPTSRSQKRRPAGMKAGSGDKAVGRWGNVPDKSGLFGGGA